MAATNVDVVIAQRLSGRVEAAIRKVLGDSTDEFDAPDFDAVEYVNKHFPSESSLSSVDTHIRDMEAEIAQLDESILATVREQSVSGAAAAKDIAEARDSIGDLASKIRDIARKAEASERMVQDICRDIKQLDVAKKHLTNTIQAVARLQTLSVCVADLSAAADRRAYEEAAPQMEAALQMFTHFAEHRDVPKVSELYTAVKKISEDLERKISDDFEFLVDCITPETLNFDEDARGGIRHITISSAELASSRDDDLGRRELDESQIQTLRAACDVIDALGPAVRKRILNSFIRKQMRPYASLFRQGTEVGDSLEGVERRLAWFNIAMKTIDIKLGRVLPSHWRVMHRMCVEFATMTRNDLTAILGRYDPPSSVPAEPLLKAIVRTKRFEETMHKKFEADRKHAAAAGAAGAGGTAHDEEVEEWDESQPLYNDRGELVDRNTAEGIKLKYKRKAEWEERKRTEAARRAAKTEKQMWWASLAGVDPSKSGIGRKEDPEPLPPIVENGRGIISTIYEPYMGAYVRFERANIDNSMQEGGDNEDSSMSTATVLRSSSQLFNTCRTVAKRCSELTTGEPLYDLFKEIRHAFADYAAMLSGRLPRPLPADPSGLPGDTFPDLSDATGPAVCDTICLIANTAEHCAETLPALEEAVKKLVDERYRDQIEFAETQERFFSLQGEALKTLGSVVASMLDPALHALAKSSWTTVTEVGDQSPYVGMIQRTLRLVIPRIRARLGEASFRNFCDKFIRAFTPRYRTSIFLCKKIGDMGAQQMLLDAQGIKTILTAAPTYRGPADRGSSMVDLDDDDAGSAMDGDAPAAAPSLYVNFISRELPRIEMWLKIAAAPKERFVDTIKTLWPQAVAADVVGLLERKNITPREQEMILVELGHSKAAIGATPAMSVAGMGAAMKDLGAKMNVTNMSKLFGGVGVGGGAAGAAARKK